MRDQVQKLEGVLNVCVLQSVGEQEGEGKSPSRKISRNV